MNLIGILLGVAVATVVVAPLLWRTDPDEYEQRTFPSIVGYGQAEGFFGWILPLLLAPIAGVVTAVIAWNLWLLPVVTLAGAILGIVVGLGGWMLVVTIDKYWFQLGMAAMYVAEIVLWIGGPATTILVGVLALMYAPDLSLPLYFVGLLGALVAFVSWRFRRWRRGLAHLERETSTSVPDVRGLTLPEAHLLAESAGLYVSCAPITPRRTGNEVVVTQEPAPGEVVNGDSFIRVTAAPPPAAANAGQ